MSSNEWREWFLTENGWIQGTVQLDFKKQEIISPPDNWVLTGKWSERQSGVNLVKNVFERQLAKGQTEESIKLLIEKFGDVPNSL